MADAPDADSPPAHSSLRLTPWWCFPSQFTQSLLVTSRCPRASSGLRPGAGVPQARP
jgi:hypothetical protein